MAQHSLERRSKAYFELSSHIAQLNNTQLRSLLDDHESNAGNSGWGTNQTLTFGELKVFAKRVPVTALEYENLFSTKNLYNLPTYCNYGLGSTGFSVFRELVTHIKTTQWVLDGQILTFPLLYHHRIMPYFGPRSEVDEAQLKSYMEYWGNSENAGQYLLDRASATHELVLCLEHIPHVLGEWLRDHPGQLQPSLRDLRTTIDFLSTKGIIHFDAHFYNALTDGDRTYLTDFGLVLDKSFGLTKDEENFLEQNALYDYGEILRNLGHLIRLTYDLCTERDKRRLTQKYCIEESLKPYEVSALLLDNIEHIHADNMMQLDDFYVASVIKYRRIITLMQNFFVDMWVNPKKDTQFPEVELKRLLKETEFLP